MRVELESSRAMEDVHEREIKKLTCQLLDSTKKHERAQVEMQVSPPHTTPQHRSPFFQIWRPHIVVWDVVCIPAPARVGCWVQHTPQTQHIKV